MFYAAFDSCFSLKQILLVGLNLLCYCFIVNVVKKKHLKNVGPIHHCEPPHAHSLDVATGTFARRLRIDVHDDNDGQRQRQRVTGDRYGPMEWAQ